MNRILYVALGAGVLVLGVVMTLESDAPGNVEPRLASAPAVNEPLPEEDVVATAAETTAEREAIVEETAETEASPPPPSPPRADDPVVIAGEEEAYKWLFETTDMLGLKMERDDLEAEYMHLTTPHFLARFGDGRYDVLEDSENGWRSIGGLSPYAMDATRQQDDGTFLHTKLEPDEFPEAFELRKKMLWINELINVREHEDS